MFPTPLDHPRRGLGLLIIWRATHATKARGDGDSPPAFLAIGLFRPDRLFRSNDIAVTVLLVLIGDLEIKDFEGWRAHPVSLSKDFIFTFLAPAPSGSGYGKSYRKGWVRAGRTRQRDNREEDTWHMIDWPQSGRSEETSSLGKT